MDEGGAKRAVDDFLLIKAVVCLEEGRLQEAQDSCMAVLRQAPGNGAAYNLLGLTLQHKGEWGAALEAYEKAVACDGDEPTYLFNKAVALAQQGDDEAALRAAAEALRRDPENLQLHYFIRDLYARQGRQMDADRHNRQATALLAARQRGAGAHSLSEERRALLLSAFSETPTVLLEEECRLLLQGTRRHDGTTDSFMTASWDQYFRDLSCGSYRTVVGGGRRSWRGRAWHFLFKNLALVERLFSAPGRHLKLLDIGCASGYLRRFLEGNASLSDDKQIYYWGLDIREEELRAAVAASGNIESGAAGTFCPSAFVVHDIAQGLPYRDAFFDVVVSFETIKYLPVAQGREHLRAIGRVLTPEGELYISNSYEERHPGFMVNVPFARFEAMLQEAGLSVVDCHGAQAHYDHIEGAVRAEHRPLFDALSAYHPRELVAAMVTPLYPELATQRVYRCRRA